MTKNGDSSLLFSLDSLMAHERDRVVEETRAAEQKREADRAAKAEAERHARMEAERRIAEEQAWARAEHQRRLDEEARLEDIRQAEKERVLAETRQKNELELRVRQSSHELRLTAEAAVSRARSTRVAFLCTAAVAVVATCGAVYLELGVHRARVAELTATYQQQLTAAEARGAELRTLLAGEKGRLRTLEGQLLARPAATECVVPASAPVAGRPATPTRPPATVRPPVRPSKPCKGDPNDPLNPCL